MGIGLKNFCTASGKWDIYKVVPRLFGWIRKNSNKTVLPEFSLQVIFVVSQPGKLRSNPSRKQFLFLLLWSLCSNPMEEKVLFV